MVIESINFFFYILRTTYIFLIILIWVCILVDPYQFLVESLGLFLVSVHLCGSSHWIWWTTNLELCLCTIVFSRMFALSGPLGDMSQVTHWLTRSLGGNTSDPLNESWFVLTWAFNMLIKHTKPSLPCS